MIVQNYRKNSIKQTIKLEPNEYALTSSMLFLHSL